MQMKHFRCYNCGEIIQIPYGYSKPTMCPKCGSTNIQRVETERGPRWVRK